METGNRKQGATELVGEDEHRVFPAYQPPTVPNRLNQFEVSKRNHWRRLWICCTRNLHVRLRKPHLAAPGFSKSNRSVSLCLSHRSYDAKTANLFYI
ncbi:hypothetical protein NLU13_4653 [Sarocladium strictum]|uniref:Uncharacterized protein n=1 Tax=Sarocladium strictum TaxID=5046 RepID=A0AA39GK31_SARSR|nr:hypothetical protein NLU13_4653 [Sarocladium strictum]